MAEIEIVRDTAEGKIITILDGDETKHEKAVYCDWCYGYKRQSHMMTIMLTQDDWVEVCLDCRKKDKE